MKPRRSVLASLALAAALVALLATGLPLGLASSGSTRADSPLKKACGARVSVQTDWFPSAERGYLYQLAGLNGTLDKQKGRYSGQIGKTGVQFEIRSGGPFSGFQQPISQMYQDPTITLAVATSDEQIQLSKKLPLVSIVAPQEFSPQIVMWNPEKLTINNWNDVRKSGATVLVFAGGVWIDYLVNRGFVSKGQVDTSYDGSPTRFVTSGGGIVQQGFVSGEPFQYANDIEQYKGKQIKFLLISSSGYVPYPQTIAVRKSELKSKAACWKLLVPLIQKAQLDYFANPLPVNQKIEAVVKEMATFWQLSPALDAYAVRSMKTYKIVQNGPNCTIGDFSMKRLQGVVNQLLPIYESKGLDTFDPGLKAGAVATNQFIDPKLGFKTAKCKK
ncbi:MAG: hypothetical protein U0R50_01500 [Gaiellales bacterium]